MRGPHPLRERFWFVPTVLCTVAVVLAEVVVAVDQRVGRLAVPDWLGTVLYRVGESGSRDLLGAIASSSLAVAGTTFSITMAVLALTSSSYGPRLVRNFMADRGNQVVLGVYVATFLYSLLVLRSIRTLAGTGGSEVFVPHLAVNVAVLLAVLDVGVLVYFIHHISDSIQVSTIAGRVRSELVATVDRLYPARSDDEPSAGDERAAPEPGAGDDVRSGRSGYVLAVAHDDLVEQASRHDVVVALAVRPGTHVLAGEVLATVHPAGRADQRLTEALRSAVRVGDSRTPAQDLAFAVQQLTEMAVRALSPGTNDPYTALNALDDLTVGLVRLVGRDDPSPWRRDRDGDLRVHAPAVGRTEVVVSVLEAVRWYATGSPAVVHRAVELARRVAAATREVQVHQSLRRELELLATAFAATHHLEHDVQAVTRAVEQAVAGLAPPPR